jgi:hypothetical protein
MSPLALQSARYRGARHLQSIRSSRCGKVSADLSAKAEYQDCHPNSPVDRLKRRITTVAYHGDLNDYSYD